MLTALAPGLWTLAVDHRFLGLRFGARMTVVRLADGGLLVHSPVPLTEARREAVAALGPVRFVVAPNLFHHLYAADWARAFPEARLLVAEGLEKKRADLPEHGVLDGSDPWGDALVGVKLEGQPAVNETAFWHPASGTLITCDLVANLPPTDHLWTRVYAWMTGLDQRPAVNAAMRLGVRDRAAARKSVDRMLELHPRRILMSHGEVLETDAEAGLRRAWAWCA